MKDQAEQLRNRIHQGKQGSARTIAVVSGKGGVGKSNFSLNFSIILSKMGKRVLLFDMDIGMGNIDILMGKITRLTIVDFFQNGLALKDIISTGPEGVSFIGGGSGMGGLLSMGKLQFERFLSEFSGLQNDFDYILFDMGAGISDDLARFIVCVDDVVAITTPEPTSIMDAYSMIKYINKRDSGLPVYLVCNRVQSAKQGRDTEWRLKETLKRFVQKEIVTLGFLPDSKTVLNAVSAQTPFTVLKPKSDISLGIEKLALDYVSHHSYPDFNADKKTFVEKLKTFFLGGKQRNE